MSVKLRGTAMDMIANPDFYSADEMIDVLIIADDLYTNDGESFIEDNEYDALRMIASKVDPAHKYFTGVGSDVRGGKVKLPYEMGSLDQVEIGDITDWVGKWSLQDEPVVITDKMDGTSALIIYDEKGEPQIAYSRGNGTEGADISRHIFKISNVPNWIDGKCVIRAEVELSDHNFEQLKTQVMSRSGKPYKNARNMVAGLMNSKTNPDIVYEYLDVIAYEVVGSTDSKLEQIEQLKQHGFDVTPYYMCRGHKLNDEFLAEYINDRRNNQTYAIDGIVIDVNSADKRAEMNPTRDTLNPAYSIKYKVADA